MFNIEIDFRTASNQPTTVITNTFLVSTNVAKGDVNYYTPPTPDGAYPGYWFGSGTVPDVQSPYAVGLGGNQEYLPAVHLDEPGSGPVRPVFLARQRDQLCRRGHCRRIRR